MEALTLGSSPLPSAAVSYIHAQHPSFRNGTFLCKRSSSFGLRQLPSAADNKYNKGAATTAFSSERNRLDIDIKSPRFRNANHCLSDAIVCHAQAPEAVAARGSDAGGEVAEDGEALLSENSKQRSAWARETLEANLAEASSSIEERSGASDTQVTTNGCGPTLMSTLVLDRESITGGAFDFRGATAPLTVRPIPVAKKIVLVRHGLSAWNAEGRIQGSSDLSKLSDEGIVQAEKCKQALANLKFSSCFASPISRAKTSAEVIWSGREEPLIFLDSLKEANLLFLEGMRNVDSNGVLQGMELSSCIDLVANNGLNSSPGSKTRAVDMFMDAKVQHPELYRRWREDPLNFHVGGVYPVVKLWAQAREAWQEILSSEGELVLVVTHKSILRALLCTALGMGADRFRAVDINNGGISVFTVNTTGEPMLKCLNMTAHLHSEGVFY